MTPRRAALAAAAVLLGETAMSDLPDLVVAESVKCGPVAVAVLYRPETDMPHVTNAPVPDVYRDRIEVRVTNGAPPGARRVEYQSPTPPLFYYTVFRVEERHTSEGPEEVLVDITEPQIDIPHTGTPEPATIDFSAVGDVHVDRLSYKMIPSITPETGLRPGRYLLRLAAFDVATVGGAICRIGPVDMPITVRAEPFD